MIPEPLQLPLAIVGLAVLAVPIAIFARWILFDEEQAGDFDPECPFDLPGGELPGTAAAIDALHPPLKPGEPSERRRFDVAAAVVAEAEPPRLAVERPDLFERGGAYDVGPNPHARHVGRLCMIRKPVLCQEARSVGPEWSEQPNRIVAVAFAANSFYYLCQVDGEPNDLGRVVDVDGVSLL